jgi:hypothetical protein
LPASASHQFHKPGRADVQKSGRGLFLRLRMLTGATPHLQQTGLDLGRIVRQLVAAGVSVVGQGICGGTVSGAITSGRKGIA